MIERLSRRLAAWVLPVALVLLAAAPALAADDAAEREVALGYVELTDDGRYRDDSAYAGIVFRTLGRPFPGAEVGIADAAAIGRVIGVDFTLRREKAESVDALAAAVTEWVERDAVHFVLADLPAPMLLRLADAVAGLPVLLLNVSAPDDHLRGADCRANVAHVLPSTSMVTDALTQYLVAKGWRDILVLQGPAEADARLVEAMAGSARKFGAEIVETKPFVLGTDPRQREQNNIALLTGGADADVVFVADTGGEFGRYVPYQTVQPRPVVGTHGLVPRAWHWTWHRHGAPQLQHRFEDAAPPRRMNSEAWAAWAAVKAVTQAALRSGSTAFGPMRDFMLGDALNLDGVKGNPMSFRAWDRQLRQPILLTTPDAVIARAPLKDFLHRRNVLDTLGADEAGSTCTR